MTQNTWLAPLLMTLMAISACSDKQSASIDSEYAPLPDDVDTSSQEVRHIDFSAAANNFAVLADEAGRRLLASCARLQNNIDAFLKAPSDDAQAKAQQSYHPCHQNWRAAASYFQLPFELSEQKEFYRLVDLIDTRPFVPGYIDGIPEYPFSGLVNEMDLSISAGNLRSQHRLMDEESASLGFPVIESFLWRTPVAGNWQAVSADDDSKSIERRQEYLMIAMNELLEQVTQASLRWQPTGQFSQLPERAQLSYVLRSLQRLTLVELVNGAFADDVISDPEWAHPAWLSGQGRAYLQAQLNELQALTLNAEGASEFSQWLDRLVDAPVNSASLGEALASAQQAVALLPENYPADSTDDEVWQGARQQVAALALQFSQLSQHLGIAIIAE